MSFDRKFSELSQEEQKAAKEEYGSRSNWMDAKSRSQGFKDKADQRANKPANSVNNQALDNDHSPKSNDVGSSAKTSKTMVNTKNGKVEAPSWYKNSDGSVPSTMQTGLTKEQWESKNAPMTESQKQRRIMQGKSVPGSSSSAPSAKEQRDAENAAYRQSRLDIQAAKHAGTEGKNTFAVDHSDYYRQQKANTGSYSSNQARNQAIEGLMGTGMKFGSLDVERELGSGSTHSLDGLYKAYGGIENYKENHGVGSGNYTGRYDQSEYMSSKDAQGIRDQRDSNVSNWYQSSAAQDKYGQYDWFQRDLSRFNAG